MQSQSQRVDYDLSEWLTVSQWFDVKKAGGIFKNRTSFEWFIRNHHGELVESGEFIPRLGSSGSLCGPGLAAKVIEILRREAMEAVDGRGVA